MHACVYTSAAAVEMASRNTAVRRSKQIFEEGFLPFSGGKIDFVLATLAKSLEKRGKFSNFQSCWIAANENMNGMKRFAATKKKTHKILSHTFSNKMTA